MSVVDLSILIVSWNTRDIVAECLESIEQNTRDIHVEVIVTDNASSDGTADMIQKRFPWVTLIQNDHNAGFARGNNQAAAKATGKFLMVLNSDTRILPGGLQAMMSILNERPDVGLVGPHIQYPDGSHQDSVRSFPTLLSHILVLLKISTILPDLAPLKKYFAKHLDYKKEQEVDQVMGSGFMMRKELFDELGGFDETYWIWMEEVDLMKRVTQRGHKVLYTPKAEIIHHGGQSFSQAALMNKARRFAVSSSIYFRKHHSILAWLMITALVPVHLFLTLLYAMSFYGKRSRS